MDLLSPAERGKIVDSRLRRLIDHARCSPYYGKILKGIEIKGADDLHKIPILTRDLMERGMGIGGEHSLATSDNYSGGYVSRSGGSTGKPKFSIYDGHDWEMMISHAVRC